MDDYSDYELHSSEGLFQEGMDLLESDHCEEALHTFDALLIDHPCHAECMFQRGITLIKLSRLSEAIQSFELAISLAPSEALFHSHCGYALLMDGKPEAALERFEQALVLQPESYENKVYKACVLAEKRRLGEARALLEEVLVDHAEDIEVLRHYASVLTAMGEDEPALAQYVKILKVNPNHMEALGRRGYLHLRQGRQSEAINSFREYLAFAAQDARTWGTLIEIFSNMENRAAVIATATDAIESGAESADILVLRGKALLHERQYDAAIYDLRRARSLNDNDAEIHFLLARAFAERGRLSHALLSVNNALRISAKERRYLLLKARVKHQLGDLDSELEILQQILKEVPEDFMIIKVIVENLTERQRYEEAAAIVDVFLYKVPRHRRGLFIAADLAEHSVNPAKARTHFRELFSLKPVSSKSYRAYAGFLIRQQDPDQASIVLGRACEAFPQDASLQTLRAVVLQMLDMHEVCVRELQNYIEIANATAAEVYWLLGKSYYARTDYENALRSFQTAREVSTGAATEPETPEFICLIAEAYSLHHLGRTVEGIELLEANGARFAQSGREYHEVLAELYNHTCAYARSCSVALKGLEIYPQSPALHYRLARCSAALNRKLTAFRHLEAAIELDPRLLQIACQDNKFQRYALNLTMNRLVNYHFIKRRGEFVLYALAAAGMGLGVMIISELY